MAQAAPVTMVLFPRTLSNDDDVRALVDMRKKLRASGDYEVITYDPGSAAIKRAADEVHHLEWLTGAMGSDGERLALTRALGASFAVIVSKAEGRGKMDVRVDEAAPSARVWSGYDEGADDAARFVRQQSAFALAHQEPGAPAIAKPAPAVASRRIRPAPVAVSAPAASVPVIAAMPAPVAVLPTRISAPVAVPAPAPPVAVAPLTPALQAAVPPPAAPLLALPPALAAPPPDMSMPSASAPTVPPAAPVPLPSVPLPDAVPSAPLPAQERPLPAPPAPVPIVIAAPPASVALPLPVKSTSAQPAPKVPMAVLPGVPSGDVRTLTLPSPLPIPAPSQVVVAPAPDTPPPPAPRTGEDLVSVRGVLAQGDDALSAGNFVAAIAAYRDAINKAPLAMTPRLRLAQAYLQSDRRDKALSEAQRALELSPSSPAVQQFLMQLDAETGSSDGAVTRFQAGVAQSPQNPAAHLALADALWNNGALTQAQTEYQTAQTLAGPRTSVAQQAAAHLARLYAAQSRYSDSLAALKDAGAGGYALALGIVQSRADALRSMMDAGQSQMESGKITHEAFYKTVSDAAAQAQALADFVVQVMPPSAFTVSHLHRVLATHLLAQQAAVLVNYAETSDAGFSGQAGRLEKDAVTEMLTAHAAEQKLGLWDTGRVEARN